MVLYHISYNLEQDGECMFSPKIPEKVEGDEDITIPRICFADTIQNCIRSVNGYPRDEINYIRVYEFEVDPNDEALVSWKEIYSKGYVNDAELTHEFWYLKPVKLKSRVYKITEFDKQEFIVISQVSKQKIVSILTEQLDMQEEIFAEMYATYILNNWVRENIKNSEGIINAILEKLQHEETYVEEGNPELYYQIFGEYPATKTHKIKEYYKVHMVDNLEILEVDPDGEFIINKCYYYEMMKYIRENKFELCWKILDENYVWNNGGYLYKARNLTGELIALLYCNEYAGRYMIAKYEVLSQYRNRGYGGKIIEQFFVQEGIEKETVDLIPESEDAARFWCAHGIECSVY